MLTYAHVCSRMLTYADVCKRMQDEKRFYLAELVLAIEGLHEQLTYADVC